MNIINSTTEDKAMVSDIDKGYIKHKGFVISTVRSPNYGDLENGTYGYTGVCEELGMPEYYADTEIEVVMRFISKIDLYLQAKANTTEDKV